MPGLAAASFAPLNNTATGDFGYGTIFGLGDFDESYDAPDFQNMFLAWQTVTPRRRGRFVVGTAAAPQYFAIDDPTVAGGGQFLRIDLEDLIKPSFHDPALVNFWYYRLVNYLMTAGLSPENAVKAILQPFDPATENANFGMSPQQAALVASIKRQITFRPSRDDHPDFNGSNPQSVPPANLASYVPPLGQTNGWVSGGAITYPFPEIVGPWDVDNDNDGIPDSVWVDLGDPVLEMPDGTRYRTLYAIHVVDLDGRLNINAAGSLDDVARTSLDPTLASPSGKGNLAHDLTGPRAFNTSNYLSKGSGYGPADVSLRPIFPPAFDAGGRPNRVEDSNNDGVRDLNDLPIDNYATLLAGRLKQDRTGISGRYGFDRNQPKENVSPGTNYRFQMDPSPTNPTGEMAAPDLAAQFKQFDYPWVVTQLSAFASPPDLKVRYAIGLDYYGQPVYEMARDYNPNAPAFLNSLLTDSPYELNLSSSQRRDSWKLNSEPNPQLTVDGTLFGQSLVQNDDAPFATADLEKVLRSGDADAGTIPSRLWDAVGAFDPTKLTLDQPQFVANTAAALFGSTGNSEVLAASQILAGINRRLVTTDSYTLPVANVTTPQYMQTPYALVSTNTPRPQIPPDHVSRRLPKSVAELFEVRIRRQFGWPTLFDEYDPQGDHDLDKRPANPNPSKLDPIRSGLPATACCPTEPPRRPRGPHQRDHQRRHVDRPEQRAAH